MKKQVSPANIERAKRLRSRLVKLASKHRGKKVCVFLSGGVDSQSILFACLIAGIRPVCLTFAKDTHKSTDYCLAIKIAKILGLEIIRVRVPSDVSTLKQTIYRLIRKYRLVKKPDIECLYIIKFAIEAAAEHDCEVVLTGHSADMFYGTSTRAIKYRDGREAEFIKMLTSDPNLSQFQQLTDMCETLGMIYDPFYHDPKIVKIFENTTFREVAQPGGKCVTKEAFKEDLRQIKGLTRKHQNYQLGDTGFEEMFKQLLDTDWNLGGMRKSAKGIYNDIIAGKIGKPKV